MPTSRITPHDRYIRSILSDYKVAREFFSKNLPASICSMVNLDSISLQAESFIDDRLRLQIADLLYAADFDGEPGFLYILIEHASKPDKLMPFRLLKYTMAVIDSHLKKNPGAKLPLVYPLVLYTGKNPFSYSTDLFDLFGKDKSLAKDILLKPYHLIDLTQISDEELEEKYDLFNVAAFFAKHIHDRDLMLVMRRMVEPLKKLEKFRELHHIIYKSLAYLIEAGEVSNIEEFFKLIVKELETVDKEKIMTIAEQLRKEGRVEGKTEGRAEGRAEGEKEKAIAIACNMIAEGFSLEVVSRVTEIPVRELKKFSN